MKTIKFTDKEIDFLRDQYEMELEEAENYIESIKNILDKLGSPEPKKVIKPIEKSTKKRGRKPKVVKEAVVTDVIKKQRKSRVVKAQPLKQEEPKVENIITPVPIKKTRKPRVAKTKTVKQEKPKADKNTTTIPAKKERKPRSDIGKIRAKPIQPISQIISSLREKKKEEVVPTPTALEPKPVQQSPKPNTNFKKKKFRPKRPRIIVKKENKPLQPKEDIETPKTEINPDKVD